MRKIFKRVTFLPRKLKNNKKIKLKDWIINKLKQIKGNKNKLTYEKNKVTYEIEMIDQTVDFIKGTIHKTYKIMQKVRKSGIFQKIVVGFATVVLVFRLISGSGKPELAEQTINQTLTLTPIERVQQKNSNKIIETETGTRFALGQKVNNPSLNEESELEFLGLTDNNIIFVKDSGGIPSVEGYGVPSLPSRPAPQKYGHFGSRTSTSNGGSGAPKKDPNGGWGSSPQSPLIKKDSKSTPHHPHLPHKSIEKYEQCSLEKENQRQIKEQNLKKSKEAERELAKRRGKRIPALIAIRGDIRYFFGDLQTRDKFTHAPDFGVKLPESFDLEYAKSLPYKERLKYLRDPNVLPEKSVRELQEAMRDHVLDPTTQEIRGTFGANREKKEGIPKSYGTHFWNKETGNVVFFGETNQLKSGWKTNRGQQYDIKTNKNLT
jgi:hypothetical protein